MTVVNVTQMWSKNGGSFTSEKYDSFASKYAITEGYQVLTTPDTNIVAVESATGLPRYGDRHSSGIDAFVNSIQPQQVSPIFYVVTVGYEGDNPFTGEVDVDWTDTTTTEPIDRDFDGKAIVTANGEQVEGLTVDLADAVCVITRKFLSFDQFTIAPYRFSTNSDLFLGYPPGTVRLMGFSARNKFKFGVGQELWTVTARLQCRRGLMGATDAQAWYKRYRHEGMYVKDGSVIRRALDEQGREAARPVLLKADGTQETNPNNAIFKYEKVYDSLPYSALGLI